MSSKLQKRSSSSSSQKPVLESLICDICPHNCLVALDTAGRCGVIRNESSKLVNAYAGYCSNIAIEPIEKRPFFHVLPGSKFLSVGFYGCSFSCDFCLPGDTLIKTADGLKRIDQIQDGEPIIAVDCSHSSPQPVLAHVGHVHSREAGEVIELEVDGRTIQLTPEHPVLTRQRGWVEAGDLTTDDEVLCDTQVPNMRITEGLMMLEYQAIDSIRRIKRNAKVYNFDVPRYETYIANGFVVHNCQNHRVSQQTTGKSEYYSPRDLVQLALERNVQGIAFTYNEPTIYHDYIEEVGHEIGRLNSHLKLVIKTSGFVRPWVIRNLCLYADAINVDIKGDGEDYDKICGGSLGPVVDCIEWIIDMDVHLEISYLVLPSKVHDDRFNVCFRNWLADLNPDIPVHLLYFYPFHRMVIPSYKPSELLALREKMLEKLNYVYISNHFGVDISVTRDTICARCGKTVVTRQKGSVTASVCCGKLPGVYARR